MLVRLCSRGGGFAGLALVQGRYLRVTKLVESKGAGVRCKPARAKIRKLESI